MSFAPPHSLLWLSITCLVLWTISSATDDESPIKTSLEYEYAEYSCEAQKATAVLSIAAVGNRDARPVLSLTSVMDVSGSMVESKMQLLQATNNYLVERLSRETTGHKFGSVIFSTKAQELTPLQTLTDETKTEIQKEINATEADGLTNLLAGIQAGIRQQTSDEQGNYIRVVFVFTDGKPTRGERDAKHISDAVQRMLAAAEETITVYTFGFGEDLDFDLLDDIAEVGNGVMYILSDEVDVPTAFGSALGGLLTSVAFNMHYWIKPTGQAKLTAVRSGGVLEEMDDGTVMYLGDLFMQEHRDIVIEIRLSNTCESGEALEIQESFVDASTFEEITRNVDTSAVRRNGTVPTVRTEITPVAVQSLRYDVADRLEIAATSLARDDLPTCVQKIEETELYVVKGGYTRVPYLESVRKDMETVRKELENTPEVTVEGRAALDGVIDAVKKQRTGLTDAKYETVEATTTMSQLKTQKEAKRTVLPSEVKSKFQMKFTYAVSEIDERDEDYNEIEVLLKLHAPHLKEEKPPLYVTSVLDKSGSMYGDPFDLMIQTQKHMIDWLLAQKNSKISLGVILFSDDVVTLQKLKSISDIDVPDLKKQLDNVEADGGTQLGSGLQRGLEEQIAHPKCGGTQVVFLLTDGVPSSGRDTIVKELKQMLSTAEYPITVYSFGLGEFDAKLLKEIAEAGKGQLYILRDESDIASSFGDAAGGLLSVAAKKVKIEIDTAIKNITIHNVFPMADAVSDHYAAISFADMFKDETREVLLTLRAPKDVHLDKLLNIDISYFDAISCETHRLTDYQVVGKKTSATTTKRMLEKEVTEMFRKASKQCMSPEKVAAVINVVSKAIDVVAQSTYEKGDFKADLLSDLISVRTALEDAQAGDISLREACLKLERLRDLLVTQRSKGTREHVFRIEKYYDTDSRQQSREDFVGTIEKIPTRPADDVFEASYRMAPQEISSAPQNLNVSIALEPIPLPATTTPTSVVFIVDGSETVTAEQLATMKTIVVHTWERYQKSNIFESAYISIIVYGVEVTVALEQSLFSDVTAEKIENVFDAIMPGGEGSFIAAVIEGFAILEDISEQHDLVMVCLVGKSLQNETAEEDAKLFDDQMSRLDYPLTFVPLLMDKESPAAYFDRFQPWVKSRLSTVPKHKHWRDGARQIERACFDTAAKRVQIEIQPSDQVSLTSVAGQAPNPNGQYDLPDLHYDEGLVVDLVFQLGEHIHSQIIFVASFKYYDMRSFFTWDKPLVPFVVSRVEPEMLQRRIDVRNSTDATLQDIEQLVHDDKLDDALSKLAFNISVVIRIGQEDVVVDEVVKDLEDLVRMIYSLYIGEETKHHVVKHIRHIRKKLNVPAYVAPASVKTTEPVMPQRKTEKEEELPMKPDVPEETLEVDFDQPPIVKASDTYVTVNMTLRSPEPTGLLIDAHVTIILDASATADDEITQKTAKALLSLVASRRGTRRVSVFIWSEKLMPVYSSEDFVEEQIPDVIKAIEESEASGNADYSLVLEDGITESQTPNATVSVLFWVVTSKLPEGVDTVAMEEKAKTQLKDGASPLTIFTFSSGLDDASKKVITSVSQLSGGDHAQLDSIEGATEEEKDSDIGDAARKAVLWIDTTFCKKIDINVTLLGGATLKEISAVYGEPQFTDSGVNIPSLEYGDHLDIGFVVSLGSAAVETEKTPLKVDVTDLMKISGHYYSLRDQKSKKLSSTVSVARTKDKVVKEIDFLLDMMEESIHTTMLHLGKNAIGDALVETTKFRILSEYSSVAEQPLIKEIISKHAKIEHYLTNLVEDRKQFSAAQLVAETIGSLEPGEEHISDHGHSVSIKHKPQSAVEEEVHYYPELTITARSRNKAVKPHHLTIVAVLDAVDYTTLIEREVPILLTQTMTTTEIVTKLVSEYKYTVTLITVVSRDGDTKTLPAIEVNASTVQNVQPFLEGIASSGQPADLYSSLRAGLEEMEEVSDGSDRLILLFSAAFSVCMVKDPRYDELLAPYITHPIAPVKVMTFIVGPTEASKTDPISSLTGGAKYLINSMKEMDSAVEDVAKGLKGIVLQGVRLHISPSSWMNTSIDIKSNGWRIESFPKWTAALPDMKPGSSHSVKLNVSLDEWKGDADLFEYSFSFFHTQKRRWFKTPVSELRVKRAPKNVIKERRRIKPIAVKAVDQSVESVQKRDFIMATDILHEALKAIDNAQNQDDSLISEIILFLSHTQRRLFKLANNSTRKQIDAFVQGIELNRDAVGLNGEADEPAAVQENEDEQGLGLTARSLIFFGSVLSTIAFLIVLSKL